MQDRNYTMVQAGLFEKLLSVTEAPSKGKLFLKEPLGLTSMEVSLNQLPPGGEVPFYHKHKENEELYVFIRGQGQVQVDSDILEVTEGSSVRIAPQGVRTLRNTSETEDLCFIVIQAKEHSLTQWVMTDGIILEEPVKW
ncbi:MULTISPECIES: cupin domain-containing protein [unclassified Paenibacillus]|uniref:cupin domain-containing protein n=1 Tax=unclassified Paenibacillus TaxID=185978 RepID=UPI00363BFD97